MISSTVRRPSIWCQTRLPTSFSTLISASSGSTTVAWPSYIRYAACGFLVRTASLSVISTSRHRNSLAPLFLDDLPERIILAEFEAVDRNCLERLPDGRHRQGGLPRLLHHEGEAGGDVRHSLGRREPVPPHGAALHEPG